MIPVSKPLEMERRMHSFMVLRLKGVCPELLWLVCTGACRRSIRVEQIRLLSMEWLGKVNILRSSQTEPPLIHI